MGVLLSPPSVDAQQAQPAGFRAFAIEAGGGTLGSLGGVLAALSALAIARPDRCDVEDLSCTLSALTVGGIGGTLGATLGAVVAGRIGGTRPSVPGAFAGAIAGAFAGVGVVHLVTEEANFRLGKPATLLVFSFAQGVLTAAGSRIGATLRR